VPNRSFVALLVALMAFAITAFTPQLFNDGDTYWHIAAGTHMLANHTVLTHDPFSYTFAGQPWNAHEWLAEIIMALAYGWGNWGGVALLFAATFGLAAGCLTYHLGRWFSASTTVLIAVLALACTAPSLLARPHLLALPLLVIWLAGLMTARSEHRAPSFALLPVMTLWANLHGGFAFGFLLLAYAGVEALIEEPGRRKTLKIWAPFVIGAVIAAALTPQFIGGLLFPFHLAAMGALANVGEWQPTSFAGVQPFELVLFAAIYVFTSRGVKLPPLRMLMVLLLVHLALQHMRHQILFAVAAPLLLAEPLSRALNQKAASERKLPLAWPLAAVALAIAIAFVRLSWTFPRGGGEATPQTALAHVPDAIAATPVFNDYSFGGYLIFRGIKPFIDSRAELYGDDFLHNYARIIAPDTAALTATLEKYHVGWTILPPQSPVNAILDLLPGWRRVYADPIAVVHVRNQDANR
jgi:hypothetical protein